MHLHISASHVSRRHTRGFTLVELLVSAAITVVLAGIMIGIAQQTGTLWRRTTGKVEQFRESRNAFETITTRLSQATLNAYWDYDNALAPTKYLRRSELRFTSGPMEVIGGTTPAGTLRPLHGVFFLAPFGETVDAKYNGYDNLLCTWGYFMEVGSDEKLRPPFMTNAMLEPRYRPRLMEFSHPAENNIIFTKTSGITRVASGEKLGKDYVGKTWYQNPLKGASASGGVQTPPITPNIHVIAENIVAFVILPRLSIEDEEEVKGAAGDPDLSPIAPRYEYDSSPVPGAPDARYNKGITNPKNQLPPLLQVTMVAVDEAGAQKLGYSQATLDPLGLSSKFKESKDYSEDLLTSGPPDSLENKLIAKRVNYRVFSTNVVIRGAKWSREQSN